MVRVPFSADQFFGVFAAYNQAVWPAQILLTGAAAAVVVLAIRYGDRAGRWVAGFLAVLWLWTGVAYHLLHFVEINPAAAGFGGAFVVQGILFAGWGARRKLELGWRPDLYGITAGIILAYALVIYPLLGPVFGHAYMASPTFGAPCPAVIYTFGLLLLARRVPLWLLVVPAAWAVIGTSAVFAFGVVQDLGLLVSALVATPMIVHRQRSTRGVARNASPDAEAARETAGGAGVRQDGGKG